MQKNLNKTPSVILLKPVDLICRGLENLEI